MHIVFWTGPAAEKWGPGSVSGGGIGGSETAVVHMAHELAMLGHSVTCVGMHEPQSLAVPIRPRVAMAQDSKDSTRRWVDYVPFERAIEKPEILNGDVFISSRDKSVMRLKPKAKAHVLWVHDVHVGDDWECETQ